ncbi:MAG TPA: hypothetical protein VGM06_17440 [Polyangiaceae bacterium]|jgi:hypothetical protein
MSALRRARALASRLLGVERFGEGAVVLQALFGLALLVGLGWGLPGTDSWAADSISPRSCGLGAIVETYWPGHYHHYPPLHMAILTGWSLPWMALAAARVGMGRDALAAEIIRPLYMTGIEIGARLITAAMAFGVLRATMVLWTRLAGRRAGVAAGVAVAVNAVFVFYGHTGNLDVPGVFWLAWMLVELDRVASGEPRELRAMLCATAAVLTKDQTAAALFLTLPLYLLVVPWFARRASPLRRDLWIAVLVSAAVYALASGLATNPVGFRLRIAHLFGPASKPEMHYPGGFVGAIAITHDELLWTTDFTSWSVVAAAGAGLVVAAMRGPWTARARTLLPLVAAVSFCLFFSFPVRQRDHRYFLPESIFLPAYAALAFEWAWGRWGHGRRWVAAAAAAVLLPAVIGVVSMDATLLADPRYEAERYLARLPAGTHVDVVGGPIFLPRIPPALDAVRPGVEPIGDRQAIAGVLDLVDPGMDPRARGAAFIVLATELSDPAMAKPGPPGPPFATMQYRDPVSRAFLAKLFGGSLGYTRALRAACALPWPLSCRSIHHSTGGEMWIYAKQATVDAER